MIVFLPGVYALLLAEQAVVIIADLFSGCATWSAATAHATRG